jgi:hypothetical protein
MRHFLLFGTVATLAFSVFFAAWQARLIALSGGFEGLSAGQLCAVTGTVALATVTVAANQYFCAAAGTKKASSGRFHRL